MDTLAQEDPLLLLVEENNVVLDALRDWLTMAFPNVQLLEATDQSNGIFLTRSESPDVVLFDISNLGRSGVESVRAMKAAHPAAAVFALVSLDHQSYRRAVLRAGAEACACIWKLRTELLPRLEERLLPKNGDGSTGKHVATATLD